jgi:hypothetical protein
MHLLLALMVLSAIAISVTGCDDDSDLDQSLEQAQQQVDGETADLINQKYEVTVNNLSYNYTPSDEFFATEAGYQFILVTVTIKNTGEFPVVASFADFSIEADDGNKYQATAVTDIEEDFGAARSPIPGSEEIGTLAFEIPVTVVPVALWEEIGPEANKIGLPPPAA